MMLLADGLIWALGDDDIGGVKVYCDASIATSVRKTFVEIFETEWTNALNKVETEYGKLEDCEYIPVSAYPEDYGVFISVGALDIKYCWGDFCDLEYGSDALDHALKALKEKFPEIEYEGFVAYPWSDRRCGDVVQYEISSKKVKKDNDIVYDFVGKTIANHLKGEHLWGRQDDMEIDELTFVITGKLHHFDNREEFSEYIEDLGAVVTGSVSKKTSYLINNDVNSTTSKNKKAKELGIPIITEAEFLCRFGDPDEFDIDYEDDYFWTTLPEQMCDGDVETFSEIAESLYTYKDWIGQDDMVRTFNSIIDMLCETDPDIRDDLKEEAKRILAGEKVEKQADQLGNLPDGYMEALEMFMMAEEISGEHPKRGEVMSSEGTFDLVIEKAEAGDPEAKFTAGKYFIASHIEGEQERANQWIKDAADAGVEEAIEYLNNK